MEPRGVAGKEPVNAPKKMLVLRSSPGPVQAEGCFLRPLGDHVLIPEALQGLSLGAEECRPGKSQLCLLEFSRQQETRQEHCEGAQAWFCTRSITLWKCCPFSRYFLLCQPPKKLLRAGASYIFVHPRHYLRAAYKPLTNQHSKGCLPAMTC